MLCDFSVSGTERTLRPTPTKITSKVEKFERKLDALVPGDLIKFYGRVMQFFPVCGFEGIGKALLRRRGDNKSWKSNDWTISC